MTTANLNSSDLAVIDAALYAGMQRQIDRAAGVIADAETSPFPQTTSDSALDVFTPPTVAATIAPMFDEYQRIGAVRVKLLGWGGPKSQQGFEAEARDTADRLRA